MYGGVALFFSKFAKTNTLVNFILQQILHRRLGARNVLLKTDPDTKQVRAKLAGFGPLKGEQEAASGVKKRV